LRGVIEREDAPIGVLLTFHPPTRAMKKEAVDAGTYYSPRWGRRYPRLQILTIADLLSGKRLDCPPLSQVNRTLPKVQRYKQVADSFQRPLPGAALVDMGQREIAETLAGEKPIARKKGRAGYA